MKKIRVLRPLKVNEEDFNVGEHLVEDWKAERMLASGEALELDVKPEKKEKAKKAKK